MFRILCIFALLASTGFGAEPLMTSQLSFRTVLSITMPPALCS